MAGGYTCCIDMERLNESIETLSSIDTCLSNKDFSSIFIDAPNDVLRERLIKRGDKPEDIELRLSRSEMERSYKHHYDIVIENIDLEKTLQTLENFIDKARKK